jgi:hypothetical protein
MANWKEIAFKSDLTTAALQSNEPTEGQIGIGSGTTAGEVVWQDMADNTVVVGDGGDAKVLTVSGDIALDSSGGSNAVMTIVDDKVVTTKIKDDNVTLAKIEDSAGGTLLVHHHATPASTVPGDDYSPSALAAGTNGQVLKTVVAGDNKYLQWGDPSSTSSVDVTDGSSQTDALPVNYASAVGDDATIYGDAGQFTYDQNLNGGTLAVPSIAATTVVATNFTGTASLSAASSVTATTNSTCSVALFTSTSGDLTAHTDPGITYNATDNLLTVSNLAVTGTTTTLNTQDLVIQDNTITLSVPSTAANGTIATGANSGIVVCTNGGGGDGDDTSGDVTWNPRIMWKNTATTIDGATGISNVGSTPVSTTLGWFMAGRGGDGTDDTVSDAYSKGYNIAPMVIFGGAQANYPGEGSGSYNTLDVGIGAQFLTNSGSSDNGAASRLFIQVA